VTQVVRQGARIAWVIVMAAVLLLAFLLILNPKSPSQAVRLEPIANNSGFGNDILPESGAYHGAVVRGLPTQPDMPAELIDMFEIIAGKKLSVIKVYQFFKDGDFYQNWADFIHYRGAIEFLSFDPIVPETITVACDSKVITTSRSLHPSEVMSPTYVGVIEQFASHIKAWGHPLILSFAGEMNGCWCPPVNWQGCYNEPNGPEEYIQMYRYVHDKFRDMGADNVIWAWVINHESIPITTWNQVDNYYPGDEYVDIISIDGYNWGNDGPGGCPVDIGWKTFGEIFSATLASLSSTHPTKPFIIGEFASSEGPDPWSKANWITDAYGSIKADWPQIKAAVWFNVLGDCSFQVESSLESMWAYRQAIADPYFIGGRMCRSTYLPVVLKCYQR